MTQRWLVYRHTDTYKACSEQKDDHLVGTKTSREYMETLDMHHYLKKTLEISQCKPFTGNKTGLYSLTRFTLLELRLSAGFPSWLLGQFKGDCY